jgi:catechol 2,3-dioxygenase-like lactoylglutathione lyase family enzyme
VLTKEDSMLKPRSAFSGFSATDIAAERSFYADVVGLDVTEENGMLNLKIGGQTVIVYPKDDHQPATFTVLNLEVDDIDGAADALARAGVTFERYEDFSQDDRGIMRDNGPPIAWFKDPAGNILSIIQTAG